MTELSVFRYEGGRPGPQVLILGGVHGDEPCGTMALARLKLELETGILKLVAGRLTIVPISNPAAYKIKKRFVGINLNRIIAANRKEYGHPEDRYASELISLIDENDTLLDLHSYTAGTLPFAFLDYPTEGNRALITAQGISHWVTGWPELYSGSASSLTEGDTVSYANQHGKNGILIECGKHDDPASIMVAYRCIRRTLAHFGMMVNDEAAIPDFSPQVSRVIAVITRDRDGRFTRSWQHLDSVCKGEPLISYADGTVYVAPMDGCILLPNPDAMPQSEWLYIGKAETQSLTR